eukprot:CAMPEP_0197435732 /NCGR_PEP_ID=MMETSP1175-20131217/3277_1 /TAXON_ID=1003142 /ORGANISM="Triceratium dubium, Strain CCMP147" /LENGTH=500 /DNA_ID=CAMNT_0042964841 /DNA_START=72 /DNA_END=1574 /DNA_ORIENTATION=-
MGVTFRSGGYIKHVYLGKRTVKDGEACAIWNDRGQHRQVVGPERVWLLNSTVRFLTRIKAENHQYLRVCHRDGRVEHINGPCSMYRNPAWHDEVTFHDGIDVKSGSDCIVVYRAADGAPSESIPAEKTHKVQGGREMKVIRGPVLFRPKEGEQVHEFKWSSTLGGAQLIEGRNSFSVLHTDKERSWKVTLPVATSDLASFSAQLSFKYHMTSLEKLMQATDPIRKMFTGLRADGQVIGSKISSEQLRSDKIDSVTSTLTSLSAFPSLVTAANDSGFCVTSVTLIELDHGSMLKQLAGAEQKLAAKLRGEKTGKAQRQELYELELDDRRKRIEREAELERREAEAREEKEERTAVAKLRAEKAERTHQRELYVLDLEDRKKKVEQEAEFKRLQAETNAKLEAELHAFKDAAVERQLAIQRKEMEGAMLAKSQDDEAAIKFLKALKETGVNMSDFMCTAGGIKVASATLSRAGTLNRAGETADPKKGSKSNDSIAWEVFKAH